MEPPSFVEQPRSNGYAWVEARIFDGEQFRRINVCVDTGADTSCVDDRFVRALQIPTAPTKTLYCHGISGRTVSKACAKFSVEIGGKAIQVHATVLPTLHAGLLLGMNTLQTYDIDVLNSKRVVKIGNVKVPMGNRLNTADEYLIIKKRHRTKRLQKRLSALIVLGIVVSLVLAVDAQRRESTLTRRMRGGERLGKHEFLYVLDNIDRKEERKWEDYATKDQWRNARWEAYCRNVDVDVVLSELSGRQIVTSSLMRWKHEPDEGTMAHLRRKVKAWQLDSSGDYSFRELVRAKGRSIREDVIWLWCDMTWRWRGQTGHAEEE